MGKIFEVSTQVTTDGDMAANITSSEVDVTTIPDFAVQFSWSGTTPVGNILVQATLQSTGTDFGTIDTIALSGNTGSSVTNYNFRCYRRIRVVYSRTSGTGTAQCFIVGKS